MKSAALKRYLGRAFTYAFAIVVALWVLAPIYLLGVAAFCEHSAIYTFP